MSQYPFISVAVMVEVVCQFLGQGVGGEGDIGLILGIGQVQVILHAEMLAKLLLMLSEAVEDHQGRVRMIIHRGLCPRQSITILPPLCAAQKHRKDNDDKGHPFHIGYRDDRCQTLDARKPSMFS